LKGDYVAIERGGAVQAPQLELSLVRRFTSHALADNLEREATMIVLIGQYDSPFVRRVGIAMTLYGLPFEHRPWSVWGNAEDIARFNPLRRVPVVVLEGGEVLIESGAILDGLDELVGAERALLPRTGVRRRDGLRVVALATGLADKAVSLLYEQLFRSESQRSATWVDRCHRQIEGTLRALETDRAGRAGPWWLEGGLTHADIAVACTLRFLSEAHGDLYRPSEWLALEEHRARSEALPSFQKIYLPITNRL
jgi:glutathione S-transferase